MNRFVFCTRNVIDLLVLFLDFDLIDALPFPECDQALKSSESRIASVERKASEDIKSISDKLDAATNKLEVRYHCITAPSCWLI